MAGFLCGVVNKFLTNFEDLIAVYLFGFRFMQLLRNTKSFNNGY